MNVRKQKPPKENSHAFEIEGRLVMRAEGTEFDLLVGSGLRGIVNGGKWSTGCQAGPVGE